LSAYVAELGRIARDLAETQVPWALIGALAFSVHAEPRTTKDIDVAVALSSSEALEELVQKLVARGYFRPQLLMHAEPVQRLGIRLFVPKSRDYEIPLDLLNSSSGIENEVVLGATRLELLPGVVLPVASLGHLLAMKLLSQNDWDRARDNSDIVALLSRSSPSDIETAQEAISLITERGFNRGKDLVSVLNQFLEKAPNF